LREANNRPNNVTFHCTIHEGINSRPVKKNLTSDFSIMNLKLETVLKVSYSCHSYGAWKP
jgi:hypothetical protein